MNNGRIAIILGSVIALLTYILSPQFVAALLLITAIIVTVLIARIQK